MRPGLGLLLGFALSGMAVAGEIAPADKTRGERVAALIQWARGPHGRYNSLQGKWLRLYGLGESDLPAKRKAYEDDDAPVNYAVYYASVGGRNLNVLVRLTPTQNLAWRVGPSGEITDLLFVDRSGARFIKDPYLDRLEETIKYLETEKQQAQQ